MNRKSLMRKRFEARASGLGLSSAQWRLLVRVAKEDGVAQARLAELLEIEPISVSRLVDRMEEISNAESIAAMQLLSQLLGRRVGPSTGTNFVAMLRLANEMRGRSEQGSILSLLCDSGERYLPTYCNDDWVAQNFGDCSKIRNTLQSSLAAFT